MYIAGKLNSRRSSEEFGLGNETTRCTIRPAIRQKGRKNSKTGLGGSDETEGPRLFCQK